MRVATCKCFLDKFNVADQNQLNFNEYHSNISVIIVSVLLLSFSPIGCWSLEGVE